MADEHLPDRLRCTSSSGEAIQLRREDFTEEGRERLQARTSEDQTQQEEHRRNPGGEVLDN